MRRTILAVAAAAATATLGITGVAAASGTSQTEHFSIINTSATSRTQSIIFTGAFTAGGIALSGGKVDTVKLPEGTFKIAHMGKQKGNFNPKTCLDTITGAGTYVLSSGTGAYKGISGSGTYRLSIRVVAGRSFNGKCSMTVKPQAFQLIVNASGPVSLP